MSSIISDSFFVIDSTNLGDVKTKLYGYCIANDDSSLFNESEGTEQIIQSLNPDNYSDGAYVLVQNFITEIRISQDFVGSFGLYLYEQDKYFALSNSFVFLVDFLKQKKPLTLDRDYINAYFLSDLTSMAYSETMVKEIRCLPKNVRIIINKNNGTLALKTVDYKENTVPIDSLQALKILDQWYYKWISIINYLKSKTSKISVDLSGGMDSRMTFLLFIKSGIDLDTIKICSINNSLGTHKEDYEIANAIAKEFGFKLNMDHAEDKKTIAFSLHDSINLMAYTRLCFCTEIHYDKWFSFQKKPFYQFTGSGGEALRRHWDVSPEEFMLKIDSRRRRYNDVDFGDSVFKILGHAFSVAQSQYHVDDVSSSATVDGFYRETRCRNHFGKALAADSICNIFSMAPLLDSALAQICLKGCKTTDRDIILAVIFDRYCPELLNFKFDSNKSVEKSVLEYAHEINTKYPLTKEGYKFGEGKWIVHQDIEYKDHANIQATYERCKSLLYRSFLSEKTFNMFIKFFDSKIYDDALHFNRIFHSEARFMPILGTVKIISDIVEKNNSYNTPYDFFIDSTKRRVLSSSANVVESSFATACIDIKNYSEINNDNDIEIATHKPDECIIQKPAWFHKNGIGYVIESNNNVLDMNIACLDDGLLIFRLRSKVIKNRANQIIDYYVDYRTLTINGHTIFDAILPCSRNESFYYRLPVKKGEYFTVRLEWEKHNYMLMDFCELISLFSGNLEEIKAQINKLENEKRKILIDLQNSKDQVEKLKNKQRKIIKELDNIKSGWSFKIGKVITFLPRKIRDWRK